MGWNLQQINGGGRTDGPPVANWMYSVTVFNDQQHFTYSDNNGVLWNSWYDGPTSSWNLQQITGSFPFGLTAGPPANTQGEVFVSMFRDQQHFSYMDPGGIIWDPWYDGITNT